MRSTSPAASSTRTCVRASRCVEKLGQVFSGLADSPLTSVDVEVRGEIVEFDVSVLKLAALKGIFTNVVSENVSYVNAPLLAEQRGIEVRLITDSVSEEYRNLITLRGALSDGSQISVSGTLTGTKQIEKLVEINGYDVEVPLAEHLIVMIYDDRPGIVAIYGHEFGEASINIAGMQIARTSAGGKALSVLTVDSRVPEGLLEKVRIAIDADLMHEIDITESLRISSGGLSNSCRGGLRAYSGGSTSEAMTAHDAGSASWPRSTWSSSANRSGTRREMSAEAIGRPGWPATRHSAGGRSGRRADPRRRAHCNADVGPPRRSRRRDGSTPVFTDGPFSETAKCVTGYYSFTASEH